MNNKNNTLFDKVNKVLINEDKEVFLSLLEDEESLSDVVNIMGNLHWNFCLVAYTNSAEKVIDMLWHLYYVGSLPMKNIRIFLDECKKDTFLSNIEGVFKKKEYHSFYKEIRFGFFPKNESESESIEMKEIKNNTVSVNQMY